MSHYTEPMYVIILSKKSLVLVLFCLKRVNINDSARSERQRTVNNKHVEYIYTQIHIRYTSRKTRCCFPVKIGTSTITRNFARPRRSGYSRVPLYQLWIEIISSPCLYLHSHFKQVRVHFFHKQLVFLVKGNYFYFGLKIVACAV